MKETQQITVQRGNDRLQAAIIFSNRKTLEIAVYPDKQVILKAPIHATLHDIEKKVIKRFAWIKRQQRFFDQFHPLTPPRKYVGGETHLYLGKRYRLALHEAPKKTVSLKDGYFHIHHPDPTPENVKSVLKIWYLSKAKDHFRRLFEDCFNTCKNELPDKPELHIRPMKRRWGSLSSKGTLTLNVELIKAPKDCIRYVIFHELCHMKYKDHSAEFQKLISQFFSDWKHQKMVLEQQLA